MNRGSHRKATLATTPSKPPPIATSPRVDNNEALTPQSLDRFVESREAIDRFVRDAIASAVDKKKHRQTLEDARTTSNSW